MDSCSECGSLISADADRCFTCGADAAAPNVRAIRRASEAAALNNRFEEALARSVARGCQSETDDFARALERSSAVVNCDLPFLREFVTRPSTLFANYHRGVQAGTRRAAEAEFDRDRVIADAVMFGSYHQQIRFAALSLTDTGLGSYGAYSMKLRDIAVARRSSLLEENSFSFIKHHSLTIKTPLPPGFRSTWQERGKLAVAKLADFVEPGMNEAGFQGLLIADTGDRETDRFIEVHIFGTFDREAVETVSGPKPKRKGPDAAIWAVVKEQLKNLNKSCYEI